MVQQSGKLYLRSPLDFETTDEHFVDVIARDAGSDASETQVRVTVRVTDVNDFAPRVTVTSHNSGVIQENKDAGIFRRPINEAETNQVVVNCSVFFQENLSDFSPFSTQTQEPAV